MFTFPSTLFSSSGFDADAQAFFTAASITDNTQKDAIDALVVSLKADSLWNKIYYMYPFVGGTASQHSYNLKDPSLYQITWGGSLTHSSTGVISPVPNGYGDTGFNPNTAGVGLNSTAIGFYSRTDSPASSLKTDVLSFTSTYLGVSIHSNIWSAWINSAPGSVSAITNTDKLITATRTASNVVKGYRGATEIYSDTLVSTTVPSQNISVMCLNAGGIRQRFTDREHSMHFLMDGLTPSEITDLNTAVETYQTALSRNV